MSAVLHHKVVASLPGTLEADSVYWVRTGVGYDCYVTNGAGMIVAYPANQKWMKLSAPSIASGTLTLNLIAPTGFVVGLDQNVTTVNFSNIPSDRYVEFTVVFEQDGTGGRTITWPASVQGTPAQPESTAGSKTMVKFATWDGGSTIYQLSSTPL